MRSPAFVTRTVAVANVIVVTAALMALWLIPDPPDPDPPTRRPAGPPSVAATVTPKPAETPAEPERWRFPPPIVATPESARTVRANEAGLVPVLMYHRILKKRIASIDRTPADVRDELERLAEQRYVPVTASEFVDGRIDIPAGTHPVVLTFDDGHESHFALGADGMPAKDTAVRIIYDVAQKYPDFRPVATFWVNREPFGLRDKAEQQRAVRWLTERGFEVGNHTWGHPSLTAMSRKRAREQIVRGERMLRQLGVTSFKTFALPYGARPGGKTSYKGEWDGTKYDYRGVFFAGAEPSRSPYDKEFDRTRIQRVQSNGKKGECRRWCSKYWLEWLGKRPGERYTSDGDPGRISVPKKLRGNIAVKGSQQVNAY
ncbi:polysaccharide deacetylase family protein [Spongiactinospora sp. TRM90649]|uniref:polysaccharide deacetylase family protein n=1 Tax=Spongiactinospora sp. TRM90649 TaxID=3031114 RepID=UPI0023F78EEF|nr:polysaccharide deacetylase family protein [Spongiactinospora sp. TRM90649]MDF5755959.1 polysaccharide deacetylase family protein [Spongiactinospora sp. TRM90649]